MSDESPPLPVAADAALIESFCDDTADAEALARIRERMTTDDAFRRELAWTLRLRGLAGASVSAEAFADRVMERCDELNEPPDEEAVMRRIDAAEGCTLPFPATRGRRWLIAAMVAQTLLLAGVVTWRLAPESHAVVATVTDPGAGDAFLVRAGERLALTAGLAVRADDLVYADAATPSTLTWADGSTVRLSPYSYAQLREEDGAKRLAVFSGSAQLDVRPQRPGAPMEVVTGHSRCVVRGTRFDISASGALTQLQVEHGSVEMRARDASAGVPVRDGEYSWAGAGLAPRVAKVGDPVYASRLLTKADRDGRRVTVVAPLGDSRKLYLVVTNGGDNNRFDHAAWVGPKLIGPAGVLDLTTLDWRAEKSGMVTVRNGGFFGETPAVGGVPAGRCVVTHATSVIEYDVPAGYDRFEAEGVLLDSGVNQPDSCPSVTFEVYTVIPESKLNALRIRKHHY